MHKKVVGLGAGGHAKGIIEILRARGEFDPAGLLDSKPDMRGQSVLGVPVLGDDSLLPKLKGDGFDFFFVGLGSVGDNGSRRRLYESGLREGLAPVAAIHPAAIISSSAELGRGAVVMAGAVLNASAKIGANVIMNTGAIIEHDCEIADHAHVATGAALAGGVRVGEGAHVGIGATVRQYVTIGEGAIIGAGAVVVKDVLPHTVVFGVPARAHAQSERGAD